MSALLGQVQGALAGTPLASLSPAARTLAEREDAPALEDRVAVGLARAIASQPETAGFLSHRRAFLSRLAELPADPLEARAAGFEADAERILALDLEDALDALRLRRREEMAFAACLDLGALEPFAAVSAYLSRLAESTLDIALDLARRETSGDAGDDFAVLGMGKLAGRELTYHSDLDLIFLYRGGPEHITRASRIGQRLIAYLTTMTGAGVAYEVDTRLRPSGRQGMLVTSFEAFEQYQLKTAAVWEHLAQLRGRVVAGPPETRAVLHRVHAHILGSHASPWPALAEMRQQVEAERGEVSGATAVKTGAGGLMDVDFLAGGGLLERGSDRFPAVPDVPSMLRACVEGGAVEQLLDDYALLRRVEARMRWVAGRGIEVLGGDAAGDVVAELVEPGLAGDDLRARIEAARKRIRSAWDAVQEAGSIAALEA